MSIENPNQPTPEEQAELEKSRTISDAELLEKGAEYVVDENGNKRLIEGGTFTPRWENTRHDTKKFLEERGIEEGDYVTISRQDGSEVSGHFFRTIFFSGVDPGYEIKVGEEETVSIPKEDIVDMKKEDAS